MGTVEASGICPQIVGTGLGRGGSFGLGVKISVALNGLVGQNVAVLASRLDAENLLDELHLREELKALVTLTTNR
jgi:hypothetical protein